SVQPAFTELPAITNVTENDNSNPTQMAWGPDGRLYVAGSIGHIVAYTLNPDYTVAANEIITTATALSNNNILGIAFNPKDPPNPVRIYIAHSELYQQSSGNQCAAAPVTYSGQISV